MQFPVVGPAGLYAARVCDHVIRRDVTPPNEHEIAHCLGVKMPPTSRYLVRAPPAVCTRAIQSRPPRGRSGGSDVTTVDRHHVHRKPFQPDALQRFDNRRGATVQRQIQRPRRVDREKQPFYFRSACRRHDRRKFLGSDPLRTRRPEHCSGPVKYPLKADPVGVVTTDRKQIVRKRTVDMVLGVNSPPGRDKMVHDRRRVDAGQLPVVRRGVRSAQSRPEVARLHRKCKVAAGRRRQMSLRLVFVVVVVIYVFEGPA